MHTYIKNKLDPVCEVIPTHSFYQSTRGSIHPKSRSQDLPDGDQLTIGPRPSMEEMVSSFRTDPEGQNPKSNHDIARPT